MEADKSYWTGLSSTRRGCLCRGEESVQGDRRKLNWRSGGRNLYRLAARDLHGGVDVNRELVAGPIAGDKSGKDDYP